MPVEQVGRLLRRWQDTGGVLSRARVIADGMRLISSLTPDERGVLARALAEEGAPELAARLGSSSGGRIDPGDLHRTAEGLLALDRDQIDHLAATLSDRDQRLRLAHEAATHGVRQLGDALDPPGPPPTPEATSPPPPAPGSRLAPPAAAPGGLGPPGTPGAEHRPYPTESLHALASGVVPIDDDELGDQMLDHPGLGEVQLTETGLQEVALAETSVHEVHLGSTGAPIHELAASEDPPGAAAEPDATTGRTSQGATRTERPDAGATDEPPAIPPPSAAEDTTDDQQRAAATTTSATAGDGPTPDVDGEHAADAERLVFLDHLGDATPEDPAIGDELVRRLGTARSAHERFTVVHPDRVDGVRAATALRVLDAVPEGWQRRRVAERLGAAGALHGIGARELLERFPRTSDVAFVVGAALDDGAVSLDELKGVVPERLLRRLTVRTHAGRRSGP